MLSPCPEGPVTVGGVRGRRAATPELTSRRPPLWCTEPMPPMTIASDRESATLAYGRLPVSSAEHRCASAGSGWWGSAVRDCVHGTGAAGRVQHGVPGQRPMRIGATSSLASHASSLPCRMGWEARRSRTCSENDAVPLAAVTGTTVPPGRQSSPEPTLHFDTILCKHDGACDGVPPSPTRRQVRPTLWVGEGGDSALVGRVDVLNCATRR